MYLPGHSLCGIFLVAGRLVRLSCAVRCGGCSKLVVVSHFPGGYPAREHPQNTVIIRSLSLPVIARSASDVAISSFILLVIPTTHACPAASGIAISPFIFLSLQAKPFPDCHCEERSDVAISSFKPAACSAFPTIAFRILTSPKR